MSLALLSARPKIIPSAGGFATPDILDNVSWESGWENWEDFSTNDPAPSSGNLTVLRSTAQAFSGSTSAHVHAEQGGQIAAGFVRHLTMPTNVYFRWYFYTTAHWDSHRKWFKMYPYPSLNGADGLFEGPNEKPYWAFIDSTPGLVGNYFDDVGIISLNTWHYWEINFDQDVGDLGTSAQVRFWFDGSVVVPTPDVSSDNTLNGDYLVSGGAPRGDIGLVSFDDNFNGIGSTSVTLDIYYDRFAISTERIGP